MIVIIDMLDDMKVKCDLLSQKKIVLLETKSRFINLMLVIGMLCD